MIDWTKELDEILEHPLFANVTAPKKRPTSSDRLIAAFQEVCDFYEKNGNLPDEQTDRQLFHKFNGILKSEAKIERCRPFDTFGILPSNESKVEEPQVEMEPPHELTEEEQLEQILNDPLLADITDGEDLGLFDVPQYMKDRIAARKEADYVGSRRPCEDFEQFTDGFKEIQQGLKTGKYKLVKFSEPTLKVGRYFVEQGIIGYLAAFDDEGKNKYGLKDGRTRVIYENGSEADIKFRTITKNLSVDGYSIMDCSDLTQEEFEEAFTVTDKDVESGTIYVLRSKSTRPEIAAIKDLYKIGFTVTSMESRLANAKNEPTYLCADVDIVATWKVYNVKSSTFEALIHKLFDCVKLNVTVDGHRPKEWFIVPFHVIETAVVNIIKGVPMMYDAKLQQIVELSAHSGMQCLSVQQPWASLICCGAKDVENRSWKPKKAPGVILIHAGASTRDLGIDWENVKTIYGFDKKSCPRSAIIGYVDVYGFTQHSDSVWAGDGPGAEWKWMLRNAKLFKQPIPYKGKLGLFNVPEIDPDNLPETY
ncbi:MAG: GIY-YIG nuclease family protein [Muribaculaceae bacterium]|nr:GIY-YIG nuclease family protein [Muribaculaceae bacterium]